MNVLMISDVYFPRVNGVSTSIESFRAGLAQCTVRTHLIAPDYGSSSVDEVGITRISSWRVPFDPEDRMMRYGSLLAQEERWRQMQFDLIHVQTPFVAHYAARQLARRLEIPLVLTYHTLFEEYLHHYCPAVPRVLSAAMARRFSRNQCNDADHVVVPSAAMAQKLMQYGVQSPMTVLPTGIPLAHFADGDGASFRARMNIPADRPLALFVGRVAHEKNIDFLLRVTALARRQVPDLLLLIAGEGPALEALRRQSTEMDLDDHVRFTGYMDRVHDLPACYAAADVFVFASRTETQGLVLLEAMAAGTPPLALSIMGTADILEGARGAVIASEHETDFAAQLAGLLQDTPRCVELGRLARADAAAWDLEQTAARMAMLYQQTLEHYRAAR